MRVLMFVIAWNLARSFGKTYCVQKCKKNGYREFDFSGTLNNYFKEMLIDVSIQQASFTRLRSWQGENRNERKKIDWDR